MSSSILKNKKNR